MAILFLTLSCKQEYDSNKCEELVFKSFKGNPRSANLYEKNCQNIETEFTYEKCQEVLKLLIFKGNLKLIENQYGEKAKNCLSENDLNKFQK